MAGAQDQQDLFPRAGGDEQSVVIKDRCVLRTQHGHRVVLVAGIVLAQYAGADRMAEAPRWSAWWLHPRCPFVMPRCSEQEPVVAEHSPPPSRGVSPLRRHRRMNAGDLKPLIQRADRALAVMKRPDGAQAQQWCHIVSSGAGDRSRLGRSRHRAPG